MHRQAQHRLAKPLRHRAISLHTVRARERALLVHLGYLGYDFEEKAVFVPNREILLEYASATNDDNWGEAHGLA